MSLDDVRAAWRYAGRELDHATDGAGILRRLVDGERVPEESTQRLVAEWERGAEVIGTERGSPLYWEIAWDWITGRQRPPKVVLTDMDPEGGDGQAYGG